MISLLAQTAEPAASAMQTWGPAAIIGAIVAVAMLMFKVADYVIDKGRKAKEDDSLEKIVQAIKESLEPLDAKITRIDAEATRTRELCEKTWSMHDSYDADGRPKWFMPHNLPDVLAQVSKTCERIAETQQTIIHNQQELTKTLESLQMQQAAQTKALETLTQALLAVPGRVGGQG